MFIVGVLLAGIAGIAAYFVQLNLFGESLHGNNPAGWSGHSRWLKLTLLLIVASLIAFGSGAIVAVCLLQ